MKAIPRRTSSYRSLVPLILVAVLAFTAGMLLRPIDPVGAEVRGQPAPQAFKSGGARSEAVLKEISATLKVIDGRIERIEKSVSKVPAR